MCQRLLGNLPPPEQLDADVRHRLAKSLEYILRKAERFIDVDPTEMALTYRKIRDGQQNPGVFARYFDLSFAVSSNRFVDANRLVSEISALVDRPAQFDVLPFDQDWIGDDFDRFQRLLFAESPEVGPLVPPNEGEFLNTAQNLREAIEIIRDIDPSIYDEITKLFVRVFVTMDARDDRSASFGGVTSLMIWGATFINIKAYKTLWDCVQFLVHEVTHALLFGLSCDTPLVLNAATESYRSPLRKDPRPMDGIYHATLVCGRLSAFNSAWLERGTARPQDRGIIERAITENLAAFRDGAATIDRYGQLSGLGKELLERSHSGLSVTA